MSNISIHCYSGNGSCDMLWLGCQASSLERSLCPSSTTLCPGTTVDEWMDDNAIRCISKDLSFTEDYWNLCYLCCNGSFVKLWTPSRGLYYKYYDSQRSKAIQHQSLHQQTPLNTSGLFEPQTMGFEPTKTCHKSHQIHGFISSKVHISQEPWRCFQLFPSNHIKSMNLGDFHRFPIGFPSVSCRFLLHPMAQHGPSWRASRAAMLALRISLPSSARSPK